MSNQTEQTENPTEWAVVELLGHKVTAGQISEETRFGKSFLRLDHPAVNNRSAFTQWVNPDSIYCVTPVSEDFARAFAVRHDPRPAAIFNLEYGLRRQLNAGQAPDDDDDYDDDDYDDDLYDHM